MERRRPPETAAGHYVLHDFRTIDWAAWLASPQEHREETLDAAVAFLERTAEEAGDLGCYSVLGHKADLLVVALRPSLAELDTFQRRFQQLELAAFTERTSSAVGVTEASGYTEAAAEFFEPDGEVDPGIERYMNARLYPTLPDVEFLSFYFMNKRRDPGYNWYDLPYEERAEHVERHGEIGKEFAGRVTQLITATTGFDDWEWGVTLFADDADAIKDLLTAMRFDPSTSQFAEFGRFYVARRLPPADLPAMLDGEPIPTDGERSPEEQPSEIRSTIVELEGSPDVPNDAHAILLYSEEDPAAVEAELDGLRRHFDHYDSHIHTTLSTHDGESVVLSVWTTQRAMETATGFLEELPGVTRTTKGPTGGIAQTSTTSTTDDSAETVRSALDASGVYAGQPHGEDIHAVVLYSKADFETIRAEVEELSRGFDRNDTHQGTAVYATREPDRAAIVSRWANDAAAETAAERLQSVSGIERPRAEPAGFTTMGMFYRVKPEHREDFLETFDDVADALAGMDGHLQTDLFVNLSDENDMFIASDWREKPDAMAFFGSDAFRETVRFGREILADRPRHVFFV